MTSEMDDPDSVRILMNVLRNDDTDNDDVPEVQVMSDDDGFDDDGDTESLRTRFTAR